MELRFDHNQWLSAASPAPCKGPEALRADWQALAARLAAGHAYQRSLAQGGAAWLSPAGSFDPAAAQHLHLDATAPARRSFDFSPIGAAYRAVNPVASGDRKTMSGIPISVAGPFIPAIEG
jgi:hypothetical protein